MDRDSKSENGWFHIFDLGPRGGAVRRSEYAVVVLHPHVFRIRGALHKAVHVLAVGFVLLLFRNVLAPHSASAGIPGFSTVSRDPHSARRNSDTDVLRIARINADGVDAGPFRAVRTPFFAFRMIPKRAIQFPRLAIILRFEKASRHRSTPDHPRLIRATRRHSPDELERPVERLVEERDGFRYVAFGHRRILWSRSFLPRFGAVGRTLHFDAEMAVVQRRQKISRPRIVHRQRDIVANKRCTADGPLGSSAIHREQSLPR